jgi:transglutaminase-like putative cysteine protease
MRRFFFAAPLLCLLFSCEDRQPLIHAIDPRIGIMGEILTISGEHFGNTREESYVTISGVTPITSSYLEWTDTRIQVRIPEFGDSGLVSVYRNNKKSNAALFSNRETMPLVIRGEDTGIGPRVLSVEPAAGRIGAAVTIRGSGFGASREESGVFFADASVEVSETEFGYELWSEREIRVRVPDGAVGGNLTVHTNRGNSRPVFFDIPETPGTKTYLDKRNYAISYSVDIRAAEAESPNRLYLWLPRPVKSASQRNVQTLSRSAEPFIENYRGTTLFQLQDVQSGANSGITLSYLVEVYAVETNIPANVIGGRADSSPITAAYTAPTPQIPSDDPRIKERSAAIVGREQNPFAKARRIYNYLLAEGGIQWEPIREAPLPGPREALEAKQADPYTAAMLFCALARAAGIPAIPVSGILLDRNRTFGCHFWAEFWVDGFGWTPVDPALGAGAAPASFISRADRANYYFGSLDNQRIIFSRGFTNLSRMDPRGRIGIRERDYALQNLWEEAVGGLTSYSSLWSDVTINGIYYQ